MPGIVSYGAYLPYWRLSRSAIPETLGSGGGRGTRSVASFDEDTTSLGVEAARVALRRAPDGWNVPYFVFSTTAPAYLDKTNATAIHAALGAAVVAGAYDAVGRLRSNVAACTLAGAGGGLAVLSDIRTGLPGGADEAAGGDAAAAIVLGEGPGVIADTDRRRHRPPASSSTGGAPRVTPTRASGRSASANTPTCPWPRRRWPRRSSRRAWPSRTSTT